jgi:RNA polymerase sigma factor (sigma-70 family)
MDSSDLRTLVDALLADYDRQGEHLSEDDVLRIATKRGLGIDDVEAVFRALRVEGIELEPAQVTGFEASYGPTAGPNDDNLLQRYLKDIGQFRLLTAQDEVHLGRRIQAGLKAAAAQSQRDCVSADVEHLVEDGRQATAQMVAANLRLVFSIAKKYAFKSNLDVLDLAQDGVFGLTRAATLFDPEKGFKFSTYATWWIRQAILRSIANKGRTIRLPVHALESLRKVKKVRRALQREHHGVQPSLGEIAEQVNMPVGKVQFLLDLAAEPMSMDAQLSGDGPDSLANLLPAHHTRTPEDIALQEQITDSLRDLIGSLRPKEALVLTLRFGLDDGVERTLEQVGEMMGVTRERVRQIQNKGLDRLRHPSRRRILEALFGPRVINKEEADES